MPTRPLASAFGRRSAHALGQEGAQLGLVLRIGAAGVGRLATAGAGKGGVLVVAALQEALVVEEQGAGERVAQVGGEGRRLVAGPVGAQGRLEIRRLVGAVEEAQERHEGRRTHEHALRVAQGIADEQARMVLRRERA